MRRVTFFFLAFFCLLFFGIIEALGCTCRLVPFGHVSVGSTGHFRLEARFPPHFFGSMLQPHFAALLSPPAQCAVPAFLLGRFERIRSCISMLLPNLISATRGWNPWRRCILPLVRLWIQTRDMACPPDMAGRQAFSLNGTKPLLPRP